LSNIRQNGKCYTKKRKSYFWDSVGEYIIDVQHIGSTSILGMIAKPIILRVDICHTGGITEGKKIATMGEVHYQELACHYTGSPVSTAAMLHLNISVPNCAVQEHAPLTGWINDVIQHDLRTEDGYLLRSDSPGLGIDLNEDAAIAYPHIPSEPPHWRREDGSVQDW